MKPGHRFKKFCMRAAAARHAPHLQADREALEDSLALFVASARPLRPPRRAWPRAAIAAGFLLAAAALFWVVGPGAPSALRPMGARTALDVAVQHDGAGLFLAVTPSRDGFLSVATVQEDGHVSPLVSGRTLPARAGERVPVDGRIRLDGYDGREWVVVLRTDSPLASSDLTTAARSLLPRPRSGPDRWVMEVTR